MNIIKTRKFMKVEAAYYERRRMMGRGTCGGKKKKTQSKCGTKKSKKTTKTKK